MERREFSYPPVLRTPPPPSTPSSIHKYKWTSVTAAKCDENRVEQNTTDGPKADTNWFSPSRGDTWRLCPPRGRIRGLAQVFDKVARSDVLEFESSDVINNKYERRIRRNSEPNYENEVKETVETRFIDDSMMEEYDDEEEIHKEYDVNDDYFERQTVPESGELDYNETDSVSVKQQNYFNNTRNHQICVDEKLKSEDNFGYSQFDSTPRRPRPSITSTSDIGINSENRNLSTANSYIDVKLGSNSNHNQHATGKESPMIRRERRGTQAIVFPTQNSSKTDTIKSNAVSSSSANSIISVRKLADTFEKKTSISHRRIDAAQEIAMLRRGSVEETSYDENSNVIQQQEKPEEDRSCSTPTAENNIETEYYYAVPFRESHENEAQKSPPRVSVKELRKSLPFSDIPEERTYEKIDEMFNFGEKTCDSQEKTIEAANGYADVEGKSSPNKRFNMSTNTYQEIEFERTNGPANDGLENDGTRYSCSSGPQFTRSPTLMTPHAGQSITEYRVSEREGIPKTEKVVVNRMITPSALATSTPIGTVNAKRLTYGYSQNIDESFVSSISNISTADKSNDLRRQIHKLIEMTETTRKHIKFAECALVESKKSHLVSQELSAQRVLLVCRERLKLQLDEVKRLQALSVVRHPPPPLNRYFKSTMVISNIDIFLNKRFNLRGSFAFIVALKCRTQIEATGVVTLLAHYQTRQNVINFGEHLHFSNLPVDFIITMEVYMMRVPEYKEPKKTCAAVLASKCKNLLVPSSAQRRHRITHISTPGQAPKCDFEFCGKLTLSRDTAGNGEFYLDDVTYPLEGTVRLVSHCSSLPESIDVLNCGYLYMLNERTATGEASWNMYWAILNRGVIFFWSKPEDEKTTIPLVQIDLTKCTNQSIEELKSNGKGRPFVFMVELLIDKNPTLLEKRRVLLAADSPEDLNSWLHAINETLLAFRS